MCSPNDPSSELEQCKQELQSCKEELEYYKTRLNEYYDLVRSYREKLEKQSDYGSMKESLEKYAKKEEIFGYSIIGYMALPIVLIAFFLIFKLLHISFPDKLVALYKPIGEVFYYYPLALLLAPLIKLIYRKFRL